MSKFLQQGNADNNADNGKTMEKSSMFSSKMTEAEKNKLYISCQPSC